MSMRTSLPVKTPQACLLGVILALWLNVESFAQSGTWVAKAPMPTPRCCLAVGVLDGNLYAIGGEAGAPLATVEAYNARKDTWAVKESMPAPCSYAAAAEVNGIIYVVGCPDSSFERRATYAYQAEANTWAARAPMPTARAGLSVAAVGGILYAIGGVSCDTFICTSFDNVEAYDPATDTWATKSPMPTPRCCMATGAINGAIYVAGGISLIGHGGAVIGEGLEVYDPNTDSWATLPSVPTPRWGVVGATLARDLYVISGNVFTDIYSSVSTVEAYSPQTNTWRREVPIATPRVRAAAGVVDDTIYVLGGYPNLPVNEAFSPFLAVAIDIKPGDANNVINLKSAGTVPVAILGSATFDPLTVDPETVTLAGAPVATRGKGVPMTAQGDFNHDGYLDLLLHFRTQDLQLTFTSTEAVLYGETFSGQRLRGADSVRIVFPGPLLRPPRWTEEPGGRRMLPAN